MRNMSHFMQTLSPWHSIVVSNDAEITKILQLTIFSTKQNNE